MERAEAARVLGVARDAGPDEARAAFRLLIRRRHPDRAGATASAESARLIEAHRVLRAPAAAPDAEGAGGGSPSAGSSPSSTAVPVDARVEGDALVVDADPATVMVHLVEAGHALGEVTYLDRASGLVEILLLVQQGDDDHPRACSLVASLQGRSEAVEVFCTIERLDGHPAPPIAPLVAALAAQVRSPEAPAVPFD